MNYTSRLESIKTVKELFDFRDELKSDVKNYSNGQKHIQRSGTSPTPFVEHDELQNDFLNYVEVVGNIWDNEISELVAQHSI